MKTSNGNGMSREQKARWDGNASRAMQAILGIVDPPPGCRQCQAEHVAACEAAQLALGQAIGVPQTPAQHAARRLLEASLATAAHRPAGMASRDEICDMAYDFADAMEPARKEHLANWEKPDASE